MGSDRGGSIIDDAVHVVQTAIRVRAREGESPTDENVARWAVEALADWPGLTSLAAAVPVDQFIGTSNVALTYKAQRDRALELLRRTVNEGWPLWKPEVEAFLSDFEKSS